VPLMRGYETRSCPKYSRPHESGIRLSDLCRRATAQADKLSRDELDSPSRREPRSMPVTPIPLSKRFLSRCLSQLAYAILLASGGT
jgi:hypothetical protein